MKQKVFNLYSRYVKKKIYNYVLSIIYLFVRFINSNPDRGNRGKRVELDGALLL